jgi:hypothetical protein
MCWTMAQPHGWAISIRHDHNERFSQSAMRIWSSGAT